MSVIDCPKIAFHLSNFSVRGTEVAIYEYAHGYKHILGGEVLIVAEEGIRDRVDLKGRSTYCEAVKERFEIEFGEVKFYRTMDELDDMLEADSCGALYILKSGENDGFKSERIPTIVHCVFICNRDEEHGDVYGGISEDVVGKYYNRSRDLTYEAGVVGHVCRRVTGGCDGFRGMLDIPESAVVVGRYGGYETFDLEFVKDVVSKMLDEREDMYFIFMNTEPFMDPHPRVKNISAVTDFAAKEDFVFACDAMLHGRMLGESFGLSIAEFCAQGRPVITYKAAIPDLVSHSAHHDILGSVGMYYANETELSVVLRGLGRLATPGVNPYERFSPERVMAEFKERFVDPLNPGCIRFDGKVYFTFPEDALGMTLTTVGWEPHVYRVLEALATKDTTFLDVGANIGYHSIRLASLVDRVIAVEPHPVVRDLLYKNVEANEGYITVVSTAFGSEKRVGYLPNVDAGCRNMGHLPINISGVNPKNWVVSMVRADDSGYLDGVSVDLMKIDCSGYEYQVLEGARELISRCRPYIVLSIENGVSQYDSGELFAMLGSLDYEVYGITSSYPADHLAFPVEKKEEVDSIFSTEAQASNGISHSHMYGVVRSVRSVRKRCRHVYPMCNFMSTEELVQVWGKMGSPEGEWGDVRLTTDKVVADYHVVVNRPPYGEEVDVARTVVMRMEPNEETGFEWNSWYTDRNDFLIFMSYSMYHNNCEWHLSSTSAELAGMTPEKTEGDTLSTVISDQYVAEGHILRVDFMRYLQASGMDVHVYGRGNLGFADHRGELPYHAKDAAIFPYKYVFNGENTAVANYFSEKLIDCILGECLTFYWGCPNVAEHVDPRAYIVLDLYDKEGSLRVIEEAIANGEWEKRIPFIRAEKQRILNRMAFLPRLSSLLSVATLKKVVVNMDSRPDRWVKFEEGAKKAMLKNYKRFSATDGKIGGDHVDMVKALVTHDAPPQMASPGVIGCASSHLRIWAECVGDNVPYLVMEDDVVLEDRFGDNLSKVWAELEELEDGWDVVFLGYHVSEDNAKKYPEHFIAMRAAWPSSTVSSFAEVCSRFQGMNCPFGIFGGGTFCYLVSPRGAEKLQRHIYSVGMVYPIDYVMMCLSRVQTGGNGFCYKVGDLDMYMANRQIASSVIFSEDSDINLDPWLKDHE
jgi:FkbM family methyltransferase